VPLSLLERFGLFLPVLERLEFFPFTNLAVLAFSPGQSGVLSRDLGYWIHFGPFLFPPLHLVSFFLRFSHLLLRLFPAAD